jgi:hypothetical protein
VCQLGHSAFSRGPHRIDPTHNDVALSLRAWRLSDCASTGAAGCDRHEIAAAATQLPAGASPFQVRRAAAKVGGRAGVRFPAAVFRRRK